jgi:hypothetical protein
MSNGQTTWPDAELGVGFWGLVLAGWVDCGSCEDLR